MEQASHVQHVITAQHVAMTEVQMLIVAVGRIIISISCHVSHTFTKSYETDWRSKTVTSSTVGASNKKEYIAKTYTLFYQ